MGDAFRRQWLRRACDSMVRCRGHRPLPSRDRARVGGVDDQMWPSAEMAQMLVDRMTAAGRQRDVVHVCYPAAGHLITPDQAGSRPDGTDMGGTPQDDVEAAAAAWNTAIEFLRLL